MVEPDRVITARLSCRRGQRLTRGLSLPAGFRFAGDPVECLGQGEVVEVDGRRPVLTGVCPAGAGCAQRLNFDDGAGARIALDLTIRPVERPTVRFETPTVVPLPDMTPTSHAFVGATLYVGTEEGALVTIATNDGEFGAPAIQQYAEIPLYLTHLRDAGTEAVVIGNLDGDGRLVRCDAREECAEIDLQALDLGRVRGLLAADLDGDGGDELVICGANRLGIGGLDAGDFDVIAAGPALDPVGQFPNIACNRVAAGRFDTSGRARLVVEVVGLPTGRYVYRFDYTGDAFTRLAPEVNTGLELPMADDLDGDGLDELYVVSLATGELRQLSVGNVNGGDRLVLAEQPTVRLDRNVAPGAVAVVDLDLDGQPDLVGLRRAANQPSEIFWANGGRIGRTAVRGRAVHRFGVWRNELLVYGAGHLTRLRPQPSPEAVAWPLPASEQAGTLVFGGIDLDLNGRSEVLFTTNGGSELRHVGRNGGPLPLRTPDGNMTRLPPNAVAAAIGHVNDDDLADLVVASLVQAPDQTNTGMVVHTVLAAAEPVLVERAEFEIEDLRRVTGVAVHGRTLYIASQTADDRGVTEISPESTRFQSDLGGLGIAIGDGPAREVYSCSSVRNEIEAFPIPFDPAQRGRAVGIELACSGLARLPMSDLPTGRVVVAGARLDGLGNAVLQQIVGARLGAPFDLGRPEAPWVAAGDVDGDLVDDLLVAQPSDENAGLQLIGMNVAGALAHVYPDPIDHIGAALGAANDIRAFAGDHDGDGRRDVVVHAAGRFYIYPTP